MSSYYTTRNKLFFFHNCYVDFFHQFLCLIPGGYGIITVMKNKKILFGTGLAGVGLLAAAGYTLTKKVTDYKRQQITQTLREFFSQMGDIQVFYFNEFESDIKMTSGGLVLEDGRIFEFIYRQGVLDYVEVSK